MCTEEVECKNVLQLEGMELLLVNWLNIKKTACMQTQCARESRRRTDRHLVSHLLEVNAAHQVHFAAMNLQDVESGALVGVGELDLAVDPARPQQCCIQNVYPIGGHQNLHQQTKRA